jgi:NAD(P)-dependent dehydrogenase (short-subunit alcohol dehydrogenase family)
VWFPDQAPDRGIGRALVDEALRRGAQRVYAGSRARFTPADERVVPLMLDVTDASQIRRAVEQVDSLDILINNAGVMPFDDLSNSSVLERTLAVNRYGTHAMRSSSPRRSTSSSRPTR